MMSDLHKRIVIAVFAGVVIGSFFTAFVFYPPYPGWGITEHWGDCATWFGGLGSMAAAITALTIAGRDQRHRDTEKRADAELADFRAGMLLTPVFGNLRAVVIAVQSTLRENPPEGGPLLIQVEDSLVVDLRRSEFLSASELKDETANVSRAIAKNVLATIAWSREVARAIDQGTFQIGRNLFLSANGHGHLLWTLGILGYYVNQACTELEFTLGEALGVPEELVRSPE